MASQELPFGFREGDYMVQCPYNASHQMSNRRMMTHMLKCRRNYAQELSSRGEFILLMSCKYNSDHRVPAPEIQLHEKTCTDSLIIRPYVLQFMQADPAHPYEMEIREEIYFTAGVNVPESLTNAKDEKNLLASQ